MGPESPGAAVSPIEFDILENASWDDIGELEPLKKVIQLFAERNPDIRVSMSPCYLTEGRKVSLVGFRRRTYLVVVFERPGAFPIVLLDVDHSGERSLSSLVVRYREQPPGLVIERDIQSLMDGLVANSGKWPKPLGDDVRGRAFWSGWRSCVGASRARSARSTLRGGLKKSVSVCSPKGRSGECRLLT